MNAVPSPLIRKLENFVRLSSEDRQVLDAISSGRVRHLGPREDVIREGDRPDNVFLFLSGWAFRYKDLEDGRRQIVAILLPGDIVDQNIFVLREMDHSIGTITQATVAEISRNRVEEITLRHPRIAQAFWWETLVDAAVQREWTLNLGQRNAMERIGHLLCELYIRLASVGLAKDGACEFPLTQTDIADAMGISAVHVNRSLQELRSANLIGLKGRILTVPDIPALQAASLFTANYLHLDRYGRHLDANHE